MTHPRIPGRRAVPAALAALGLAAAGWLAAPAAGASPARPGPGPVAGGTAGHVLSQRATLAYWTAARLRSARPADLIDAGTRPSVRPATARPAGKAAQVAGGRPAGAGDAALRAPGQLTSGAARTGGGSADAFTYPFPYDSFTPPQALWKTYPYEVNGKLFFTNDGGNYVCSATSVASASGTKDENEIWTAGHCVVNTEASNQVVDSSALFIPAYNGNKTLKKNYAPFGEFTWTGSWETASAWYSNRDLTEDEAAMTVRNSSSTGKTLGNAVGWDGFAWNYPVNQQFVAFGYPQAAPYNGKNLIEDIGATAGQDSISGGANAVEPIVIGNPMTGGSSGGAWDISWSDSGPGYINGHNDYYYTSQPDALYSPYQDTLSNEVRCFGASSC
jgi:hypothetical protein